MLYDILIFMA